MMETYWVYPNGPGLRKLDRGGITARIEALSGEDIARQRTGAISMDAVRLAVGRLEGDGLLRSLDKREREEYKQLLYRAARGESFYWEITRADGKQKERATADDFYIMSGIRNLAVLQDTDLFNYKKFNFDSLFEFTGTVGAALEVVSKSNGWKHGLPWSTMRSDKRTISSVVTSDGAGELRILQQDRTPYSTVNPFGARVHYRRLGLADKKVVEADHSTEGYLLLSILKYIDQMGLQPAILENGAISATQYAAISVRNDGIKQYAYMEKDYGVLPVLFKSWDTPVPIIKDNKIPDGSFAHFLPSSFGGGYSICTNEAGELIIGRKIRNEVDVENAVTFIPEDMDNLLKGLLYQSARGLGRTPTRHLLDMLDYRYSPDFKNR